ncbi:MAG: phosphatidate cytidylyltransferase [Bacteroidales bacterium]
MKDLFIRTATGISLIVLVAGSILLGQLPFLLIIVMIFLLAIRELLRLQPATPLKCSLPAAISGGLFFLVLYLVTGHRVHALWFLLPSGVWITGFLSGRACGFAVLALLWIFLPLALFYQLGWLTEEPGYHPVLPLSLIILVWINDTFAFLTGKWMGKHQMTPRISPGKTWEGFLGGILFTLLGGWILFRATGLFFLSVWLLISLVISVSGFWGDLFESRLKRKVNLKNTAGLLPGHGGVLDRFDSLFFAAPPFFIIIVLMQFFGR